MKQSKNYIGFVNDHSGSMDRLAVAATKDYNTTISAIKDAASREMLDTVVSVVGIGLGSGVERQVVISNPHVLKPVASWPTPGGTPLYDGIGDILELFQSLPDANEKHVSFLVIITTDGEEAHSRKYGVHSIRALIEKVQATGRYTVVFRVPKGARNTVANLGVPAGNIVEWETSAAGMAASTQTTTDGVNNYFAARSAGKTSSTVFYADASKVSAQAIKAKLVDVSKEVSLYVVPDADQGIEIRPFILRHRMEYLKGAAFYQLTKTEARVSETKLIAIRDRTSGAIYSGREARELIGLPTSGNARLHPGDHGNYDLFIQSESVNRKLVAGTGVLYWAKIGKQFTEADLAYLNRTAVQPAKPAVVQLPAVTPTNKPTPSPIPVTPKVALYASTIDGKDVTFYGSRSEARASGRQVKDLAEFRWASMTGNAGNNRWFTFN